MKRVFFSFHVPQERAEKLIEGLNAKNLPIVLYPSENLHITLKFIGEVTDLDLEKVIALGESVAKNAPSRKIDFIPRHFSIENGRLRIGVKLNDDMINLHRSMTEALLNARIGKIDNRPYAPHITIGRPGERFNIDELNMFETERFLFPLTEFGLYESQPGSQNLGEYSLIRSFGLQK